MERDYEGQGDGVRDYMGQGDRVRAQRAVKAYLLFTQF